MNEQQIKEKYGIQMYDKIMEILDGCSIRTNEDGTLEFYDRDVEWAVKYITGQIRPFDGTLI